MSDLIKRADALKVISRNRHRLEGNGQTYAFMIDQIEHIPTVDAEPVRRGKWIERGVCEYKCDQCGLQIFSDDVKDRQYCGHCGAKMDRREGW